MTLKTGGGLFGSDTNTSSGGLFGQSNTSNNVRVSLGIRQTHLAVLIRIILVVDYSDRVIHRPVGMDCLVIIHRQVHRAVCLVIQIQAALERLIIPVVVGSLAIPIIKLIIAEG